MKTLLVANRGEIVSRVARTARRRGVRAVGVYSSADASLPYLSDLDEAIHLPGTTPGETYLDIPTIIAAALRAGADAVHPGYGFLSERPEFAEAVEQAGLTFVGPSAACVSAMGSKVRAKEIARAAEVNVLPDAVLTASACDDDVAKQAAGVGYPLLVKASAGGGGRGIRLVESPSDLAEAVLSASREAQSAFGDATLFLERFLASPRHVEVQVMADSHGSVIHVGDRECSVQRRHQKLLEEAPASLVDQRLRDEMAAAAVRLAAGIGYVGAGTCEFLVTEDEWFFLEMNTRLQVEHTVTEEISGLDLVDLQLTVAEGEPLPLTQADVTLTGHSIQARICAEDPAHGWIPQSGLVSRYQHPEIDWLRCEDGIASGSEISTHYDSMVAKIIATGADRAEAIARLDTGLSGTRIEGPPTNLAALLSILRDDDYRAGSVSVNWFEGRTDLDGLSGPEGALPAAAVAAVVTAAVDGAATNLTAVPAGWSNSPRPPLSLTFLDGRNDEHQLRYLPGLDRPAELELFELDGVEYHVRRLPVPHGRDEIRVELNGVLSTWRVGSDRLLSDERGGRHWASGPRGQLALVVAPRFVDTAAVSSESTPQAPMPGTVLAVKVAVGDVVAPGQPLVVVEAMKMEHVVRASKDAVVDSIHVVVGQSVGAGQPLVELNDAEGSS